MNSVGGPALPPTSPSFTKNPALSPARRASSSQRHQTSLSDSRRVCWYFCWYQHIPTPQIPTMPLTDIQVRNAKAGDTPYKLTDGDGIFLLVQPNGGKYWRLSYRFRRKQKTLAVYPAVVLATARKTRDDAREQIAAASIQARRRRTRDGFPSRSEGGWLLPIVALATAA